MGTRMVYIVATLGFEERPVLRSVLRHYAEGLSGVAAIMPETGTRDERGEAALSSLRQFLAKFVGIEPVVHRVDPTRFVDAMRAIKSVLISAVGNHGAVVLVLGGGMRGLVIEALLAALLLPQDVSGQVQVEVDLEYRDAYFAFSAGDIDRVTLPRREMSVLREIVDLGGEEVELGEVVRRLGIPKTTAWKIVRRLEHMNLVRLELAERRLRVSVTLKGMLQLI